MSKSRNLLERLQEGVIVGDGGYVYALEKRGYCQAGPYTPEATVEFPDAVRQLHREFLRAGSDVMQALTFYATEDRIQKYETSHKHSDSDINKAAVEIAQEVAAEGDALVAGCLSQTTTFAEGGTREAVEAQFQKQIDVFVKNNLDFIICEFFDFIEEMEWAIKLCKTTNLPVCATMAIGLEGDYQGISLGECALRMAKAGADVVGLNCRFGLDQNYEALKLMKNVLDSENFHPHLMSQPVIYYTPDAGKDGFTSLPEHPFALEPRIATRFEVQNWTRKMYDLGVRYIGGCCGFETYHIRAIAEELAEEHGGVPEATKKHGLWGSALQDHRLPWVRQRGNKEYWQNLTISTGRPYAPAMCKPDPTY